MPSPVLVHDAAERARAPVQGALRDIAEGLRQAELWVAMGLLDVRQRYSRSVMGPFWVTASIGAMVLGIGITYGTLFRQNMSEFLPFLAVGIVVWTLVSAFLTEGCIAFVAAEAAIKQMPAPLSVHVYRVVWRSLIIFAHNAVVAVLTLAFFRINPGWAGLAAVPGLVLLVLNGVGFVLIGGTLSARFRDIPPLMGNVVQVLFFITPIFWQPATLGDRRFIATYNPFYHLLEAVRAPLLGQPIPEGTLTGVLIVTVVNLTLAVLLFARFRWRIPYWV